MRESRVSSLSPGLAIEPIVVTIFQLHQTEMRLVEFGDIFDLVHRNIFELYANRVIRYPRDVLVVGRTRHHQDSNQEEKSKRNEERGRVVIHDIHRN